MITNNPYFDFLNHDSEQNDWLAKLPKCDYCGEPIQDDYYYEFQDFSICCTECLESHFKVSNNFGEE